MPMGFCYRHAFNNSLSRMSFNSHEGQLKECALPVYIDWVRGGVIFYNFWKISYTAVRKKGYSDKVTTNALSNEIICDLHSQLILIYYY